MEPLHLEGHLTLARLQGVSHRHYGVFLDGTPLSQLLARHSHARPQTDTQLGRAAIAIDWTGGGTTPEPFLAEGTLDLAALLGHPGQHVDVYLEQRPLDQLLLQHLGLTPGARDSALGRVTLHVEWSADPDPEMAPLSAQDTAAAPNIPQPHTPAPEPRYGTEGATPQTPTPEAAYGETSAPTEAPRPEDRGDTPPLLLTDEERVGETALTEEERQRQQQEEEQRRQQEEERQRQQQEEERRRQEAQPGQEPRP